MANISHSTLTDPYLHEPKGVAAATSGAVYVANGSGSGSWRIIPNGYCEYTSPIGTTLTTPTTFTLIAPSTLTKGTQVEFSHNNSGRLTYTGATTVGARISFSISFQNTVAAGVADFGLFKNGTPDSIFFSETAANIGDTLSVSGTVQTTLSTNDYIEVYGQVSAGNIIVENFGLSINGVY